VSIIKVNGAYGEKQILTQIVITIVLHKSFANLTNGNEIIRISLQPHSLLIALGQFAKTFILLNTNTIWQICADGRRLVIAM
jgi:hypothetical protein